MKKGALFTVFLVVLIDLLGFGMVLPNLAFYAASFHATPLAIGLLYSIYSIAQLVFSPIWGGLSDKIGRRPIMLMSTLGASAAYVFFAFSHSFSILFLSRLLAGVMAGNISTAQAYIADVTTPEDRTKGMGLIGAAFGVGFVLGPAIGGVLMLPGLHSKLESFSFFAQNPYAILGISAAMLSFSSFLLVLFKLPESISVSKDNTNRIIKISIFTRSFWSSVTQKKTAQSLMPLFLLSIFLLAFGQSSIYGAFPLFCKDVLNLSPEKVNMQYVWMGLIAVFIQGGLIRVLVKKISEKKLFLIGNILLVAGLALVPFAKTTVQLFSALSLLAVGGSLNGPTLNSLISKEAEPSKMGQTMGTSQGLSALGRAAGPAWGGALYGLAYQAPFLATALVLSGTIFIGRKIRES